jgi:predicted acyltransferase (DUF342 family)
LIAWPFIAFAVIFVALVCAHFFFAYRAWRNSRGEQSSEIDPSYVRMEDYFARSFRAKVAEWIQLPVDAAMPPNIRIITKGQERIRISGSCQYPPQSKSEDILVVQGSFECGTGCTFDREIYVSDDAFISSSSELQSIAADGNLTLARGVRVTRWADSKGDLEIGANAIVAVRATAGKSIRLIADAQVGSAVAPIIVSGHGETVQAQDPVEQTVPALEFPPRDAIETPAATPESDGIDRKKLRRLSADCWMYVDDLKPSIPLHVVSKLIVKGDCVLPAGSVLEADLKADGLVEVGPSSVCRRNVVAGGAIRVGSRCLFQGVLHAGKGLLLCTGVRGGDQTTQIAAYAAETLWVESDVIVHGKLASGDRVRVAQRARHQGG